MYGQVCFPNLYKWTFNCLHQKRHASLSREQFKRLLKKKKKTTVAVNAFSVKSLISHSIIPYKVMPVSYHGLTVAVHP